MLVDASDAYFWTGAWVCFAVASRPRWKLVLIIGQLGDKLLGGVGVSPARRDMSAGPLFCQFR